MDPIYYIIHLGNLGPKEFVHQILRAATQFCPDKDPKELYYFPHSLEYDPKVVGIIDLGFNSSSQFQGIIRNWNLTISPNAYPYTPGGGAY